MSDKELSFKNIKLKVLDGISIIMINRPDTRNALSQETWVELSTAIDFVENDAGTMVVIVTGVGDKTFASGADIKWLNKRTYKDVLGFGSQDVLYKLENCTKPIIAAVNGYALGGGCELAMACDIRIASVNAKFGQPEVNLGIIPGAGGTQRLTELVGKGKAKELIFTGEIIDASEAMRIGLVNKVVPHEELLTSSISMANLIMKKGQVAIRLAKKAINLSESVDIRSGLEFEKLAQALLFTTDDRIEGTSAFLEKRNPEFKNE